MKMFKYTLLVIFLLFLFMPQAFSQDTDWQKSIREGENAYTKMKDQWFGSKSKYENSLIAPLMTGGELFTLDRKKHSSSVQLMCPGANPSVEVFVQPGRTKDLNFIMVKYDSNFDGKEDKTFTVQGPISGICADGIIKCDAGTWNHCHFFKWIFNGGLSLKQLPLSELTSCYCINSSCTSYSYTSYATQVITTLGTGIVHALIQANPRYAISSGQKDPSGLYIGYFSQNARKCSFKNAGNLPGYGFTDADSQYSYNMNLMAKTDQEIARQSADPDSLYSLVYNMPTPTGERKICQIVRNAYFDSTTCTVNNSTTDGCSALENDPDCQLEREKVCDVNGNCVISFDNFNPTGQTVVTTCKTLVDKAKAIECLIECKGNLGTTDGGCPLNPSQPGSVCYNGHVTGYSLVDDKTVVLSLEPLYVYHSTCGKKATYHVCGTAHISLVYPSEDDDPCVIVQKDGSNVVKHCCHDCDRGYSWSGNVTTSGIQNVFAKVDDKGACDVVTSFLFQVYLKLKDNFQQVCYPWWRIERTYYCKNRDMAIDLRRPAHIDSTINPTSSGAGYEDLVLNKQGTWETKPNQNVSSTLGDIQGQCMMACKVRKWIDPAEAKEARTSKDYRFTAGHYQYSYRVCDGSNCPLKEGEELVQGCTCVNDFNRWMSASEVFRISGIDEICSSGKKKNY